MYFGPCLFEKYLQLNRGMHDAPHPRSQALLAACVAISPGTNRMQKQFDWSFEYDGMWLFECEVSD